MTGTNISYWEKVLKNPTPAYKELIDTERAYLIEKVAADSKVLDIGCGDGRNIKSILNKTTQVVGIDNDEVAVSDAKQNFSNVPSIQILHAEAIKIPFEDSVFDVVIFFDILQNLGSQKEKALHEARRVLTKDGMIILCAYSDHGFDERIKMYNIINVPIEKVDGTKVFFEKSVGAYISEQFTQKEIEDFAISAKLTICDMQIIGNLACIYTQKKHGR